MENTYNPYTDLDETSDRILKSLGLNAEQYEGLLSELYGFYNRTNVHTWDAAYLRGAARERERTGS